VGERERLEVDDLRAVVTGYRDVLVAHKESINRLNVFPVPDGDTGTNMALTLESVVDELDGARDMSTTCKAISHGSLMGARGNSGVILSQILRGLAQGIEGHEAADAKTFARALSGASDAAYGAVMRPVEGTILTVVREAAEAGQRAADGGGSLTGVLVAAKEGGADALARTPELLPVLAEAGVVDAGGAGFVLLLDVLLNVVAGAPIPEAAPVPMGATAMAAIDGVHAEGAGSDLRYEVMYLLDAPDESIPAFKQVWAGVGDSIVVVGGDGLWNCHIHTDDIGAAIEAAVDVGRPRRIRVTDLEEQIEEERWVRDAPPEEKATSTEPVTTAVVAVATGEGIGRIFRSLGVQAMVAGGQSMNPSTAEILEAVRAAPADDVIVLPNNANIIPVARQVDELTDKRVRVVATSGIAEGFAALMEYDPDAEVDDNAAAMAGACERIVSAEVTRAVRDAASPVGAVQEGDYIGITEDGIVAIGADLSDATRDLLDIIVGEGHEIVTVIEGEGSSAAETRRITEWLSEHRPQVSCEIHHGGQPLYPYLLSVE
jgi:DAK2 domain fusion protein YloV